MGGSSRGGSTGAVPLSGHTPFRLAPCQSGMSRTGVIKNWNEEKGFGFIGPDDGGEDVFCHKTALNGAEMLNRGDKVRYDEAFDERKGKQRAQNVTLAGGGGGGGGGGYGGGGGGRGDYKAMETGMEDAMVVGTVMGVATTATTAAAAMVVMEIAEAEIEEVMVETGIAGTETAPHHHEEEEEEVVTGWRSMVAGTEATTLVKEAIGT